MSRGSSDSLYRHNPDCSKARCRACLGYGVIVLNGGPVYRACRGIEAEAEAAELAVWDVEQAGRDIPWWHVRERRAHRQRARMEWERFTELVAALPSDESGDKENT